MLSSSSTNKRKQIKPQKVADKACDENSDESLGTAFTASFNKLFNEKLKCLLESQLNASENALNNLNVIRLIEQFVLSNLSHVQTPVEPMPPTRRDNTNLTDLIKDSIDNFFSTNGNKFEYLPPHHVDKRKPSVVCPCGAEFEHGEQLNVHLKQCRQKLKSCKQTSPQMFPSAVKMVRGQEEWVNNSRHNNFISQILKCLECSASFGTLAELSVHMVNSKHFLRFQPANTTKTFSNNKNFYSTDKIGQKKLPLPGVCKLKNSISSKGELSCLICNKSFDNFKSSRQIYSATAGASHLPPLVRLIQHLQNTHRIEHICTNCGSYFSSGYELQKHLVEESQQFRPKPVKSEPAEGSACKQHRSVSPTLSCESSTSSYSPHEVTQIVQEKLDASNNTGNHLLALQMLVNGKTQFDCVVHATRRDDGKQLGIKLPAKKRPYVEEEEQVEGEDKETLTLNNAKKVKSNDNEELVTKENNYHPLNLLQRMHNQLDDYFTR